MIANKYNCFNFSLFNAFGEHKYYEFFTYNHFLGRTIWFANYIKLCHYLKPASHISQTNLKIFSELNQLANEKLEQPKFTYAHEMMPHTPYIFNEQGNYCKASEDLTEKQKYLGQLIYTNSLTLETINNILKFSRKKPIIIIQGDHGYRNLTDTTRFQQSIEAHTLFYVIYTPNGLSIPDTLNPSNTF